MFSMYFYEIDETARYRYGEKLDKAGLVDVTQEQGIHSVDRQESPRVEYPNVCNFLIQTPSLYTVEILRAYKGLDGYNFCVNNGLVSNASVLPIPCTPEAKLVIGSVKHSQRLSLLFQSRGLIAVKMEGTIACGHCTCILWQVLGKLAHI